MFASIFGHWQTTLLGIVAGAVQLHNGGLSWWNALAAAAMAALGIVAKDGNKSGGTPVGQ